MNGPSNRSRMETAPHSCPDPEALAAWLDGGVDAAERRQIEAHLATCDDCRRLVASVVETQNAVAQAQPVTAVGRTAVPPRVVHFPRKTILWGGVSALAAAAVLMLALEVPLGMWPSRGGSADSRLADLVEAVGDERTVEARLTGGFSYRPLRAAVRSGGSSAASDNWSLFAAAGKIREDATASPTASNLHALGVAHLLLGDYDEAVRAFEDAIADSAQPQYHSDLAAAYMARGRQLDRPDDFPRALDAAERALKGSDTLLEARFNRALALEALSLRDQARAAWEDYLSRDADSGWAVEARAHLQKLQQFDSPGDLARNNSPPLITETSVEAALDWLLRQGLPQWADAILATDFDRAVRERLHLSDYANRLTNISGDRFAVALLDGTALPSPTVAEAYRQFAAGLLALESDKLTGADSAFAAACADAGIAIAVLCDVNRGAIDVLQRRDAEAERRAERALRVATEHRWAYAVNQAKRLAGYRLLFKGDYAATVAPYAESFQGFQSGKYLGAACALALQLADLADIVGVAEHGWRWRVRALELAATSGAPTCSYLTRLQLAGALADQHRPDAANTVIASADAWQTPQASELRRVAHGMIKGRVALAADDRAALRDTVAASLAIADRSTDLRVRRLRADLLVLQAALLQREGHLDDAQRKFTDAIDDMGPERTAARAAALLARASVAAEQPQRLAAAAADVNAALRLLETRVSGGPTQPLRLEEAALAFQTMSTLIERSDDLQGPKGLWLVERLRQILNGVPPASTLSEATLEAHIARLPPTTVVVSYLLSKDAILAWVRTAAGWQFVARPASPARITRLLNALTVQIRRTPAREDIWRPALAELYDLLLRGVPGVAESADVAIVPDGPLNRVPFGSLFDTAANAYLFERAAVRVSPNLAFILAPAAASSAPVTAAVIGDPRVTGPAASRFRPLPRARAEAQSVARFYAKATIVVAEHATRARVLEALNQAQVVHYAGHAIADLQRHGARLLLAGDVTDPGAGLAPSDLAGRLTTPVRVVLAACETGTTSVDRATGLSSLSSALLRAGAASVVATLWDIDDAAGEMFFSDVHRALAAGHSTAQAVARAQRACRANAACRRAAGIWVGTNAYGTS